MDATTGRATTLQPPEASLQAPAGPPSPAGEPPRRVLRVLRFLLAVATWSCLAGVLAYWLGLRYIAEQWWLTTLLLYAPHAVLLAPIAALAITTAVVGPRRLLVLQVPAAAIVLSPIMGLTLAGPAAATSGAPQLRVLSFNVNGGSGSMLAIAAEVLESRADVVLLQGSNGAVNDTVLRVLPGFSARASTQFLVASRYPILELREPPEVEASGSDRSPRFIAATLETPLGKIDVYSVHPISPRYPLEDLRGRGFLVGLRTGEIFDVDHDGIADNTALRRAQAKAVAALAAASPNPVLIAGDTNLPRHSRILAETIGRWADGFDAVGRGFGYTFPVGRKRPWMRIDRILASPALRFVEVGFGSNRGSDHRSVWADIEHPARTEP